AENAVIIVDTRIETNPTLDREWSIQAKAGLGPCVVLTIQRENGLEERSEFGEQRSQIGIIRAENGLQLLEGLSIDFSLCNSPVAEGGDNDLRTGFVARESIHRVAPRGSAELWPKREQ